MEYKILYVEDEPDAETIKTLFKNYIDNELSSSLDEYTDQSIQSSAENMHNIENSVTDQYDETLIAVESMTPERTKDGYYKWFDRLPMVDFASGLLDKKDKSGNLRPGALSLLKKHANEYLLFIVDRDLFGGVKGEDLRRLANDEIEQIHSDKDIWPGFCGKKFDPMYYYSGDLLLEYLCLESRLSKKEILTRFRFLTGNAPDFENSGNNSGHSQQDEHLKNFLKTLHFTTQEENGSKEKSDFKKLTVDKSSKDALVEHINDPAVFHIQSKHEDVLCALAENAQDFFIDQSVHVPNMIKALAYAEGVKLQGIELKKPSVTLLRALGEAFRDRVVAEARERHSEPDEMDYEDFYKKCSNDICNYSEDSGHIFELSLFAMSARYRTFVYDNCKKKYVKEKERFRISDINALELFSPQKEKALTKEAKDRIGKYKEKYSQIANCMSLVQTISSQEIHHNDQKPISGKRLQLVTYALCELFLFYNNKIKGKSIVSDEVWHRVRVLSVMDMADKVKAGKDSYYVPVSVIRGFTNYIGKPELDETYLRKLGFEIVGAGNESRVRFLNNNAH